MTYLEKLRDPRWQKTRLEVLHRDDFACVECQNKEKELHVHHRYYIQNTPPWEYPLSALATLCCDCHKERTEVDASIKMLLSKVNTKLLRTLVGAMQHFDALPPVSTDLSNIDFFIFGAYLPCLLTRGSFCSAAELKDRTDKEADRLLAIV